MNKINGWQNSPTGLSRGEKQIVKAEEKAVMKKLVVSLGILSFLFLGGMYMLFGFGDSEWEQVTQQTVQKKENKLTLTKEQQDNVVRWIVRWYFPITKVEFTKITYDAKTGSYYLLFKINDDDKLQTGLSTSDLEEFNDDKGVLALDPVKTFDSLERDEKLSADEYIDISHIKITYLED